MSQCTSSNTNRKWTMPGHESPPRTGSGRRERGSVRHFGYGNDVVDLGGALERHLYVRADIQLADVLVELGLVHQRCRLLRCAAQNQLAPGLVQPIRQIFERAEPGGVD